MRLAEGYKKNEENFNRRREDIGNVIALEHINLCVPDQQLATLLHFGTRSYTGRISCYKRGKYVGQHRAKPVSPADKRPARDTGDDRPSDPGKAQIT